MAGFRFPALPAGPPSKRNWYRELLDDPNCDGDSKRVHEAYENHREAYNTDQIRAFTSSNSNPVTPDQALIKHLERQARLAKQSPDTTLSPEDDLDSQGVNCLVIWARPPPSTIKVIREVQQTLAKFIGSDLHLIPEEHLHLSVIELAHRHPVPRLREIAEQIGNDRIQNILNHIASLPSKPRLIFPQLGFDKMGIALNFLPSGDDGYTYHHLRSDMHALALESGVSIDMCYTAPSAHITLGRFIDNSFFESQENRDAFLERVGTLNDDLSSGALGGDGSSTWNVAEEAGLELQLGYLKFGRERENASMLGKDSTRRS